MGRPSKGSKPPEEVLKEYAKEAENIIDPVVEKVPIVYTRQTLGLMQNPVNNMWYVVQIDYNESGDFKYTRVTQNDDYEGIMKERLQIMLVQSNII